MKVDSQELENFVRASIEGIVKGLGEDYTIAETLQFELAIVNTKTGKGGFKIWVADASAKISKESISKIKFDVIPSASARARKIRNVVKKLENQKEI